MKSEQEIRTKLEELQAKGGEHNHAIGNRVEALKWVLDKRFEDL